MEQLYALGVSCIEFIQDWFQDYDGYFLLINDIANPHHLTEIVFPLLSTLDSVFAAQFILCTAFGGWLNAVMKWWLLEDRPYWWVRESPYYGDRRPRLRQTSQTCETGPGSPSGHNAAMATSLALFYMFLAHIVHDRKWKIPWWLNKLIYPTFGVALVSVMLARMYVAAHFPHQCIMGALVGLFLAPALCIYVSDPFIWKYGFHANYPTSKAVKWHIFSALMTVAIATVTYFSLKLCNIDPMFTVKLAFRWCENPETIHVSTTPMYTLVQCTGYLLGWALAVTPAVARYRHDTKDRSLLISLFTTALIIYIYKQIDDNLCRSNTLTFYLYQFIMFGLKPMLFLRIVPALSMWPFGGVKSKIE